MTLGVNENSLLFQPVEIKGNNQVDQVLQKLFAFVLGHREFLCLILGFFDQRQLVNGRLVNRSFKLIIDTSPSLKFPLLLSEAKWTANKIRLGISQQFKLPINKYARFSQDQVNTLSESFTAWRQICEVEPTNENFKIANEQLNLMPLSREREAKISLETLKTNKKQTFEGGLWELIEKFESDIQSNHIKKVMLPPEKKPIDPKEKALLKKLSLIQEISESDCPAKTWFIIYASESTEENLNELKSSIEMIPDVSEKMNLWIELYTHTKDPDAKTKIQQIQNLNERGKWLLSIYTVDPSPNNLKALKGFAEECENVSNPEINEFNGDIPKDQFFRICIRFFIYKLEPNKENLLALKKVPTQIKGDLTLCKVWLAIYAVDPDSQSLANAKSYASIITDKFNRSQAWILICKVEKSRENLEAAEKAVSEVEREKKYAGVWPQLYEATNESNFLRNALDRAHQFRTDPLQYTLSLMHIASACNSILQKVKSAMDVGSVSNIIKQ